MTLEKATSRELEIQQVKNAISRTDAEIGRIEGVLSDLRKKQLARVREVATQETRASCCNDQAQQRGRKGA